MEIAPLPQPPALAQASKETLVTWARATAEQLGFELAYESRKGLYTYFACSRHKNRSRANGTERAHSVNAATEEPAHPVAHSVDAVAEQQTEGRAGGKVGKPRGCRFRMHIKESTDGYLLKILISEHNHPPVSCSETGVKARPKHFVQRLGAIGREAYVAKRKLEVGKDYHALTEEEHLRLKNDATFANETKRGLRHNAMTPAAIRKHCDKEVSLAQQSLLNMKKYGCDALLILLRKDPQTNIVAPAVQHTSDSLQIALAAKFGCPNVASLPERLLMAAAARDLAYGERKLAVKVEERSMRGLGVEAICAIMRASQKEVLIVVARVKYDDMIALLFATIRELMVPAFARRASSSEFAKNFPKGKNAMPWSTMYKHCVDAGIGITGLSPAFKWYHVGSMRAAEVSVRYALPQLTEKIKELKEAVMARKLRFNVLHDNRLADRGVYRAMLAGAAGEARRKFDKSDLAFQLAAEQKRVELGEGDGSEMPPFEYDPVTRRDVSIPRLDVDISAFSASLHDPTTSKRDHTFNHDDLPVASTSKHTLKLQVGHPPAQAKHATDAGRIFDLTKADTDDSDHGSEFSFGSVKLSNDDEVGLITPGPSKKRLYDSWNFSD